MNHTDFFKALKAGEIASVYLFEGEEAHIKAMALKALREKLLPPGLETLNETILTNPTAGDIMAAAETLPMMADRRLVQVRDSALLLPGKAAGESEQSQALSDYIDRAPDTASILFYLTNPPDGRKKLTQALKKKATTITFSPLSPQELTRWMTQQLRPLCKTIAPDTAATLAFTAGHDLTTLTQELHKLAAYVKDRPEITKGDIAAITTPTLECTIFQLVDALVDGKELEAFRLLKVMLENGEARIGILAMLARQYRNLLHLKMMQEEGISQDELAKQLGLPSFALRRLKDQARALSASALRERLDLCVDTDYAIKSGTIREDAALERVMLRLR